MPRKSKRLAILVLAGTQALGLAAAHAAQIEPRPDGVVAVPHVGAGAEAKAYIQKFTHLQVLAAKDGRAIVRRYGVVWGMSDGQRVGPGRAFRVAMTAGEFRLVANANGKAVAAVPLPDSVDSFAETTVRRAVTAAKAAVEDAPVTAGEMDMVAVVAPNQPPETPFPNVRPAQVRIFDTPLAQAIEFVMRGTPLVVDLSPEQAAIPIESFQVRGALPLVMRELADKVSLFLSRHDDRVVAAVRKTFVIVPGFYVDVAVLMQALQTLGASSVRKAEQGIQFTVDVPAAKRIEAWVAGGAK